MNYNEYVYESIDLCSCYEPVFTPPKAVLKEWENYLPDDGPEPTLENTSFYVIEPDGTEYFYCGNMRIKVSEHFASCGKSIDSLIEDAVCYAVGNKHNTKTNPIF